MAESLKNFVSHYNATMRGRVRRGEVQSFEPLTLQRLRSEIADYGDEQYIRDYYRAERMRGAYNVVNVPGVDRPVTKAEAARAALMAEEINAYREKTKDFTVGPQRPGPAKYRMETILQSEQTMQRFRNELQSRRERARSWYEQFKQEVMYDPKNGNFLGTYEHWNAPGTPTYWHRSANVLAELDAKITPDIMVALYNDARISVSYVYETGVEGARDYALSRILEEYITGNITDEEHI